MLLIIFKEIYYHLSEIQGGYEVISPAKEFVESHHAPGSHDPRSSSE